MHGPVLLCFGRWEPGRLDTRGVVRREWDPEDLIACWTLVDGDRGLVGNKRGPTRLGFALMLKFFELEARFPRHAGELPPAAAEYVASQVGIGPEALAGYRFSGRTFEYHRVQVRAHFGFREATVSDEEALSAWLSEEVCPVELREERLREALLARCRAEKIEPPAASRLGRPKGNPTRVPRNAGSGPPRCGITRPPPRASSRRDRLPDPRGSARSPPCSR